MWRGEPSPGAEVAGVSPVTAQMWQGAARSRRRCGQGGRPVTAQMWAGVSPVPAQMWPTSWSQSATHSAACDGLRCALSVACRTESLAREGAAGAALRTALRRSGTTSLSWVRVGCSMVSSIGRYRMPTRSDTVLTRTYSVLQRTHDLQVAERDDEHLRRAERARVLELLQWHRPLRSPRGGGRQGLALGSSGSARNAPDPPPAPSPASSAPSTLRAVLTHPSMRYGRAGRVGSRSSQRRRSGLPSGSDSGGARCGLRSSAQQPSRQRVSVG
jgi:hypothetical protein